MNATDFTLTLLVLILVGVAAIGLVVARIAVVATQARDILTQPKVVDFEAMQTSIAALLRESIPATGASMSFRVNEISNNIVKLIGNSILRDAATDEARNADRTAKDNSARMANELSTIREKVEALTIMQARQSQDLTKVLSTLNVIQNSGTVDQAVAGSQNKQAKQ